MWFDFQFAVSSVNLSLWCCLHQGLCGWKWVLLLSNAELNVQWSVLKICIQSHNVPAGKSCCSVVLILSGRLTTRRHLLNLMKRGQRSHTHRKQCCAVTAAVGSSFKQENLAALQISLSLTPVPPSPCLSAKLDASQPFRANASGSYYQVKHNYSNMPQHSEPLMIILCRSSRRHICNYEADEQWHKTNTDLLTGWRHHSHISIRRLDIDQGLRADVSANLWNSQD